MLKVHIRKALNESTGSRSENFGDSAGRSFQLDLAFEAPPGVTILFGPSGSGKTTCLRAIAGIVRPDAGSITLGERVYFDSLKGVDLPIQHRRVGFVFQDYALFPHLTAERNVGYGFRSAGGAAGRASEKEEKRERVSSLLELLGITHIARQYPRQLSGGEAQRVALARALASDPQVVLLDEPLSAVDLKTRERLVQEIRALQERIRIPFLYVTHSPSEARAIGTRLVLIDRGTVVHEGASPGEAKDWAAALGLHD